MNGGFDRGQLQRRAPRVAIVTDSMTQRGGAERCIEAFAEAFPDAPVFCIIYSEANGPRSLRTRVVPSWVDRLPGARSRHRYFFPLFPSAVESFDLDAFDVVVSSHHSAAKGVLRNADQVHVCYCHTPMRALWDRTHRELTTIPTFARPIVRALLSRMRVWDYATAGRVDVFVANGRVTQRRISKHYGRTSEILNPPIDTDRFTADGTTAGDYYLVASRPVPYKRIDIAIDAAEMTGRTLIVAGGAKPTRSHPPNIRFVGHVSDSELTALMRGARAMLFPEEDFGMAVLEMNACGRPVIAYGAGGALDSIIDGKTGVLVAQQSAEAFARAIEHFETMTFDPLRLRAHAETFSREQFIARFKKIVADAYAAHTVAPPTSPPPLERERPVLVTR